MEKTFDTGTESVLPDFSLIICSRNRSSLLLETIDSVLAGGSIPTEVIIVDQSDQVDPRLSALEADHRCKFRYAWSNEVGLSRAINRGIAMARHNILLFTHDDVFAESSWCGTLVRALSDAGPGCIVTGQVQLHTCNEVTGGFQLTFKTQDWPETYAGRVGADVLFPLNMAMYRSSVNDVGDFDERLGPGTRFPGAEDNDFGYRALEAGYSIRYIPEAIVYHRAWRPMRDYRSLRWAYGVSQGAFYGKHLDRRDRYMLGRLYAELARHGKRIPRRLLQRDKRVFVDDLGYNIALLYGVLLWKLTYGLRRPHRHVT